MREARVTKSGSEPLPPSCPSMRTKTLRLTLAIRPCRRQRERYESTVASARPCRAACNSARVNTRWVVRKSSGFMAIDLHNWAYIASYGDRSQVPSRLVVKSAVLDSRSIPFSNSFEFRGSRSASADWKTTRTMKTRECVRRGFSDAGGWTQRLREGEDRVPGKELDAGYFTLRVVHGGVLPRNNT